MSRTSSSPGCASIRKPPLRISGRAEDRAKRRRRAPTNRPPRHVRSDRCSRPGGTTPTLRPRRYRKPRSRGRQPHRQPHPGPRRGATTDPLRSLFRLRPRPNHRPLTPPRPCGRDRTLATRRRRLAPPKKAAFPSPPSSIRRGTWHSDVRPPAPRYPSRPPAPFPPPPGLPPFPLGVYTKLQAVPRCSPFCDTRAPPPSLPRAGTGAGPRWSPPPRRSSGRRSQIWRRSRSGAPRLPRARETP